MKKVAVLVSILCLSFVAQAHTVGSGGDAIRLLFEQAREVAATKVSQLLWCSFDASVPQGRVDWIVSQRDQLVADIRKSEYIWAVDPIDSPTCAFTEHRSGAPLYLSYPTCIQSVGADPTRALFVTLHETSHHFGIDAEKDADIMATTIMNATPQSTCSTPVDDPFNPLSCTGPAMTQQEAIRYFSPGSSGSQGFGSSKIVQRVRQCNTVTGCAAWQTQAPTFAYYHYDNRYNHGQFQSIVLPQPADNGALHLTIHADKRIRIEFPYDPKTMVATCSDVGGDVISCKDVMSSYAGTLYYQNSTYYSGSPLSFAGSLTNHCLRLSSTDRTKPDVNDNYLDFETVWAGRF